MDSTSNETKDDNSDVKRKDLDKISVITIPQSNINCFFCILILLNILLNLSNGAFSTLMKPIADKLKVNEISLGLITCIFFVGQVVGIFIIISIFL
jgi:hypothetical protein